MNNKPYYVDSYYTNQKPPRKKKGFFSYFLVAVIAAIIGGIIGSYIAPSLYGKVLPMPKAYNNELPNNPKDVNIIPKDSISNVSAVAKKSMSSVVGITTVEVVREFIWEREVEGVGSGVIVDSRGYILTNAHVVGAGKSSKITVLFENGDKAPGKVLWADSVLDLAVVKVDRQGLPVAELGDSNSLQVGELAVAIGNPLGLEFERTVTSGIISGLNRSIKVDAYNRIENLIQTDASINPGNSGGPLLNEKGQVIGINTAKIKTGEGLGFAIPINEAKPILEQVIKEGGFKTVVLGIQCTQLEKYESLLGVDLNVDYGIVVVDVAPNTPAEKVGFRTGDIIIKIDNEKIEDWTKLKKTLLKYKKGDKATFTIIRDGREEKVEVVFTVVK